MTFRCIKPQCSNNCCGCNCAISEADDAAMLVVDLLHGFAVDGHDGPMEDGESQLVDRARRWLANRIESMVDSTDALKSMVEIVRLVSSDEELFCRSAHHSKNDRHDAFEPCPIHARALAAIERANHAPELPAGRQT